MATAIGLSCFSLWSCNTEDPSAAHEKDKDLVEATRKVAALEEEIARLNTENETLRQKATSTETKSENSVTATELDAKLKKAVDTLIERIDKIEKKLDSASKPPAPKPPDLVPPAPPVPPTPKPPGPKTSRGTRVGPDGKLVIDGGPFDGQPVGIDTTGDRVLGPPGGR